MTAIKISGLALTAALAFAPSLVLADEKAEVDAAIEKGFTDMDTDKDGSINRSEYETMTRAFIDKKKAEFDAEFVTLDADKDGKLAKDEASSNAALKVYFVQLDFNSDGFLDKTEMAAALRAAAETQSNGG